MADLHPKYSEIVAGRRSIPPERKRNFMQITGLKQGLWGAAFGAVAITAIGLSQLGWTTNGAQATACADKLQRPVSG